MHFPRMNNVYAALRYGDVLAAVPVFAVEIGTVAYLVGLVNVPRVCAGRARSVAMHLPPDARALPHADRLRRAHRAN
jgi:hypothetical protein